MANHLKTRLFSFLGLGVLLNGCALTSDPIVVSANAQNILIPGRVNIEPLNVGVVAPSSGHLSAHVWGQAINTDTQAHSLTVELSRDTVAPDADATQFVNVQPVVVENFDFRVDYTMSPGTSFQELVFLGSDSENTIVVKNITLDVEKN